MATTNNSQFVRDIGAWAEKLRVAVGAIQKKITFDLHAEISGRTPVRTGRARASWAVSEGQPSDYLPPATDPKKGEQLPPPIPDDIKPDGSQPTFVISNLSYIKALDEGHSQQAPNGFVQLGMQAVDAKVEQELRDAGIKP